MKEIKKQAKTQKRIDKKIAHKKDSFRLRKADRINASAFEGLSLDQVEERKKDNLVNKKNMDKTKSYARIFIDNIFNFCNTLIIILCIILIILGHADYTISSAMILLNIAIGIYQEIKAKLTVQKLSLVKQSVFQVIRGGQTYSIPSDEIVLDDVFILSAGQQIPVDGVVLDGAVEVDESILTGESEGVKRDKDQKVMAGSAVLAGEAAVRAERVGNDCYIESIAAIAKKINKPESKLFTMIDRIIKVFGGVLLVLGIMLLIAYRVADKSWDETSLMTISSVLGMIPCGMFLVTSTALAQSVLKLAKSNALPQDIYSVEMLAMVDTLLLDKTGTITDGNLEVLETKKMSNIDNKSILDIMATMSANNKDKKPTALALDEYCKDGDALECVDNLPFSSKRKYSAIQLQDGNTYLLGAPDFICPGNEEVDKYCQQKAEDGQRTILLAKCKGTIDDIDIEKTEPLCIFTLEEKLKENIKHILEWFNNNEVDIKIISGDNPLTVSAIAKKAGVVNAEKMVNCADLTDRELKDLCADTVVFGRVSPEQKVLIVNELKKQKHIVGMVGDGVNDVQALKASNCSVSFGNANETARNISRIVLMDNDFASMPKIVEEGRRVIGNIEKVSSLFIMKNIFVMVMTFIFAIVLMTTKTVGYPFSTKNLLMFEFFVVGIPPFAFALMPNQERPKGTFMRNVIKVSIPAAISIIMGTSFIFILAAAGVIEGDFSEGGYIVSLASLAMTISAFTSAFFISLPANKIRFSVLICSLVLALICAYIDYQFLNGLFIDVQLTTNWMHVVWLVIAGGIALGVNLVFRFVFRKLGDPVIDRFIETYTKTKESYAKTKWTCQKAYVRFKRKITKDK